MRCSTVIVSAITLAFLLSCGDDADDRRRGSTPPPSEFYIDIDPPGAVKGTRYRGVAHDRDDPGKPIFSGVTGITAHSFRPEGLSDIKVSRRDDATLDIEFTVASNANSTELLLLDLKYQGGVSGARLYVRTVAPEWDGDWKPTAVAPADTTVPDPNSMVVLDATGSHHPAGREAMKFSWLIDDSEMIKGGDVVTTTLPTGDHIAVLTVEDEFGNVSMDTMRIHVGPFASQPPPSGQSGD